MDELKLLQQMLDDLEAKKLAELPPPPENPFAAAEEVAKQFGLTEGDKKKFKVTIPYVKQPWYTATVEADTKGEAASMVLKQAKAEVGDHAHRAIKVHLVEGDEAKKKAGPAQSLSRKEEQANKRNTNKKRRQAGKKALTEAKANPEKDMARIAKHYKGKDLAQNKLRDAIGDDLEQLEYTPDQVAKMVPQIIKMVGAK